jgi:hypothetical protein
VRLLHVVRRGVDLVVDVHIKGHENSRRFPVLRAGRREEYGVMIGGGGSISHPEREPSRSGASVPTRCGMRIGSDAG